MSNQELIEGVLAVPNNVSELIFRALNTGMCTMGELNTTLDIEDALDLIECWQVVKYNDYKLKYLENQGAK